MCGVAKNIKFVQKSKPDAMLRRAVVSNEQQEWYTGN